MPEYSVGALLTHWRFRPSGIGTLLALILFPVFLGLGVWQLQRAETKAAQFELFNTRAQQPVREGLPAAAATRYARIRLTGRFVADKQFLLDNMSHAGQSGYHVLTPFIPAGESRWVLVNRGWLPAAPQRTTLPDLPIAVTERTVAGQLDLLPRPGIELGAAADPPAAWPRDGSPRR